MNNLSPQNLASYIDHTCLKPETTDQDIKTLCAEAAEHGFATVCVPPSYISLARSLLKNTEVKTITVVGFPLGYSLTDTKISETKSCIAAGAEEIDMVVNMGFVKNGSWDLVEKDIAAVVNAAGKIPVKVILETAALTDVEKKLASECALRAQALFLKTSTGFHAKGGATVDDVKILKSVAGSVMKVKASGGIRTTEDALKMIEAGASRLGTSNSLAIIGAVKGSQNAKTY